MQKLKFFIGIIAMICLAIGFSSCEKDADFKNSENSSEHLTGNNTITQQILSETENCCDTRSYSDCWDFFYLPQSHTFNCGYCSWYSVSAAHDGNSAKIIEIQERDINNELLTSHIDTIHTGTGMQYINQDPSSGTAKILVTISGFGVFFGTVCVATR